MSLKVLVQGKLGFLCRKSTTIEITARRDYRDLGGEAEGINSPILVPISDPMVSPIHGLQSKDLEQGLCGHISSIQGQDHQSLFLIFV